MAATVTLSGPAYYASSYKTISVQSGSVVVSGDGDTVLSSASDVGIILKGSSGLISVTGSHSTITAGIPSFGASNYDSLYLGGNYNTVADYGFYGGGVTINGSHNTVASSQKTESANVVVNGSYNTINSLYLGGNMTVNGSNETIIVGAVNIVVNGNNDTITSVKAKSIVDTGNNNTFVNEAVPGQPLPYGLLNGNGTAGTNTTPGAMVSITGSGTSLTSFTDNNTVVAGGGQNTVSALSYNNAISVSGSQSSVLTQSTSETIAASGAGDTISAAPASGVSVSPTAPSAVISLSGNSSVGTVYNAGTPIVDVAPASFPVIINIANSNVSVTANAGQTINDSIGGNHFSISAASLVNISGNDTLQVADGTNLSQDSISGSVVNFGSNDLFYGMSGQFTNAKNTLNVTGNNNTGIFYGADQDTLNENGTGNLFILEAGGGTGTTGGAINVSGDNAFITMSGNNTINASNGAQMVVQANNNVITGSNISLQIMGTGNQVNLTGPDTVSSASPYTYDSTFAPNQTTQNSFTVQGGVFSLGGLDKLLQTQGAAQITLFGGNAVTLSGANDTVTAGDQIYGGNTIVNNGANNLIALQETNFAADTIIASASTTVTLTDIPGMHIGGNSGNAIEKLTFIGSSGTSSTILGSASNAAITMSGGASSANAVYGGFGGGNSLNGGTGGANLFVAGGANDVLIGGSSGNNTLVSAAGNETFFTAATSTDLISITGGGGTDMLQAFSGSLQLASNLSVLNETTLAGSLNVTLNDGTKLIFSGLASVTQNGGLFTH
ncbi:hypothetical protein [Acidocella sp.]|uniref:beta strand repeat-containing protein n=1 Tax=Acidocella sp. TaxID=50710 RepID=UPI002618764B|nr:hypothetical protein [Acidocella sp.]MDD2796177.1 hypothetical protein [Acidocella sp.]